MQFRTMDAALYVSGKSPSVLELADGELADYVKQRNPIGSLAIAGKPLEVNYVVIEVPVEDSSEASFRPTTQWLKRHREVLLACDAEMTLEFCTYIPPDTGSVLLTMPHSLIQIAADLNLNLANHAIRLLSETEFKNLKR